MVKGAQNRSASADDIVGQRRLEGVAMGVWKAKREARKSIWFRVPASLKQGFDELRQRAEAEGMCGGTFAAAPGTAGLAASRRVALPSKPSGKEPGGPPMTTGVEDSTRLTATAQGPCRRPSGEGTMEVPKNKREGTEVISMGVSEGKWRRRRLYLPWWRAGDGGGRVVEGARTGGRGEFSGQRAR